MTTTTATNTNNGSTSKRLSGLFNKAKQTVNEAQQSFSNKNSTGKTEPAKSSTSTNVKDFVQRVKSLKSNTGNNSNKKAPVPPPKDKHEHGTTSNQILDDLKRGANVVSQKVKDLTSETSKQPEPKTTEKEPLKRRVTRLVNSAATTINKKTAKA